MSSLQRGMKVSQVLDLIETAVMRNGSAKVTAEKWGVSEAYLCDVRQERRSPGPKILKALCLKAETTYFWEAL